MGITKARAHEFDEMQVDLARQFDQSIRLMERQHEHLVERLKFDFKEREETLEREVLRLSTALHTREEEHRYFVAVYSRRMQEMEERLDTGADAQDAERRANKLAAALERTQAGRTEAETQRNEAFRNADAGVAQARIAEQRASSLAARAQKLARSLVAIRAIEVAATPSKVPGHRESQPSIISS